jgi:hypothetical protein
MMTTMSFASFQLILVFLSVMTAVPLKTGAMHEHMSSIHACTTEIQTE